MQTSLPGSLTGTLPLASPSSNTNNQGALSKSPLSTNLSNIGSFSDKQSFVSSNVQLPLQMDPFLTQTNLISRRSLGDGFDVCLKPHNLQFLCTADNRVIFASGFWDKSFRIYSVDSGRLLQVVYGHFGVVTCMARSECGFTHDCYIVTGSEDCTIMLWLWGHRQQALLGDMNCREVAQPRLTITGHQAAIVCIQISGELGLIASASRESKCLLHTTQGELLRTLQMPGSFSNILRLMLSRDGYIVLVTAPCVVSLFNLNGRALGHIVNVEEGTSLRSDLINDNALVGSKISSVAMTREGDYVVLASEDGCVRLRRFHNLELVHCYPRCDAAISSVTITTDQRFILAGLCNGCIVMFNVDFNKWHYEYRDRYPAL